MGSIVGKAMDENLKKNQQFMLETQKMQMERQLHMQNLMRERMMAFQLARSRELFNWLSAFYATALVVGIIGVKKGKRAAILPIFPLTFMLGYQADLCFGTKINRILGEAENILNDESALVATPAGLPSFTEIDERRTKSS